MDEKYEQTCWNCGSQDLELDDHGIRCQKCGATYNKLPKLRGPELVDENIPVLVGKASLSRKAGHPSPGVQRRAARARSKASA